jgi:hydrogenase nickel incorporation protein HypA/HybF
LGKPRLLVETLRMHELSIAMSMLDVVEEEMQRHPGARLEAIHVRIGELSGVVRDSLLGAYELAREQTPFPKVRLIFEDVPIAVYCATCGGERGVRSLQHFCCVECDTPIPASEIRRGRELELAALELEEE